MDIAVALKGRRVFALTEAGSLLIYSPYRVGMSMYPATQDPRLYPPLIVMRMIAGNELGVKTGKGFYDFDGRILKLCINTL